MDTVASVHIYFVPDSAQYSTLCARDVEDENNIFLCVHVLNLKVLIWDGNLADIFVRVK